jgi:ATP-binding cassette subfamily B protein
LQRTILKGPPILLLDEATSALDSHTEKGNPGCARPCLARAHHAGHRAPLSTIVGADEIIVLDQGVIAERGTHHQLLLKNGLYASMWNRQREAEEAREKLALIDGRGKAAPNRNPPPVDDPGARTGRGGDR